MPRPKRKWARHAAIDDKPDNPTPETAAKRVWPAWKLPGQEWPPEEQRSCDMIAEAIDLIAGGVISKGLDWERRGAKATSPWWTPQQELVARVFHDWVDELKREGMGKDIGWIAQCCHDYLHHPIRDMAKFRESIKIHAELNRLYSLRYFAYKQA